LARIHDSAIVDPRAEIEADVEVGPFCHVHAGVRIGAGTRLISHVVVMGNTTIGRHNVFFPFGVIGGEAQIRKDGALATGRRAVEIGDHNVFRESVTVNAAGGDGATKIGVHNLLMAGCHVAHDVVFGSHSVVANGVQIAGHVHVGDWVTFGGLAAIAQRLRVGESAFVAGGAMCERDVPPFVIVQGDRARVRALNVVGLERRGVPEASIRALKAAFRAVYSKDAPQASSVRGLDRADPFVARFAAWLERSG
jgi:UDP-N-acetylglucosamine acyltransferase